MPIPWFNEGESGGGNELEDKHVRKYYRSGWRAPDTGWRDGKSDWVKVDAKGNRPKPPTIRPSAGTPTDQLRSHINSRFNLNEEGRKIISEASFDMPVDDEELARKYPLVGEAGGFAFPRSTFGVLPRKIVVSRYNDPEIAKSIALHEAGHTLDFASRQFAGIPLLRFNHDDFVKDSMRIAEWLPEMRKAVAEASSRQGLFGGIDGNELLAYVMQYVQPEFLPPSYIQKYLPAKYMNQGENYHKLLRAVYDTSSPLQREAALIEEWERNDRNSWKSIANWDWDFAESAFDWKRNR